LWINPNEIESIESDKIKSLTLIIFIWSQSWSKKYNILLDQKSTLTEIQNGLMVARIDGYSWIQLIETYRKLINSVDNQARYGLVENQIEFKIITWLSWENKKRPSYFYFKILWWFLQIIWQLSICDCLIFWWNTILIQIHVCTWVIQQYILTIIIGFLTSVETFYIYCKYDYISKQ